MPELPEAEYMMRMLAGAVPPRARIAAACVLRNQSVQPQRPREFEDALAGRRLRGFSRRAKNVLIHLDGARTLRIQLGMTGHVYWTADARTPPRFTRVMIELTPRSSGGAIVFEDARVFGRVHLHADADLPAVFAAYGPEPLADAFRWRDLRESARGSRIAVKPFLLDQSRVAGLGNIWAAEACFHARLSPFQPVNSIEDPAWRRLHSAIRRVLGRAIEGTLRVTRAPHEFPEADLLACAVYGREGEPCRRCRTLPVERRTQAARSTFFCPHCQALAV